MALRRRLSRSRKSEEATIEWVALIDMVFILLLFFAVTTTFASEEAGIDLQLPSASSGSAQPELRVISIKKDGSIFYNDRFLSVGELGDVLAQAGDGPSWEVRADRQADYEAVIGVLDQLRIARQSDVVLSVDPR
ncbi:biopolymer transporter ExbD [bacterium]|nr:biopolymer transporter ExbD [bacterium]